MPAHAEEIGQLASTINSFGFTVTIIAVFLFIFLAIGTFVIMQMNKTTSNMINTNNKVINQLISQNEKFLSGNHTDTEDKKEEKDLMNKYLEINSNLRDICSRYINKLDAERLAIYVFHNGSSSTHGLPFFKMSCVSEYVSRGNISRLNDHLGIPLNLFDDTINLLYEKGIYYLSEENLNSTNQSIYKLLPKTMINSCLLYALYNSSKIIIGIVVAEYSAKTIDEETIKNRKELLETIGNQIAPIIEYSEYNKNLTIKRGDIQNG